MKKGITGFDERYAVDNMGNVYNVIRNKRLSIKTSKRTGYCMVSLYNNTGIRKTLLIHRIVAIAFIPNPKNKREVNHKDGDKTNNRAGNLEWVTTRENSKHAHDFGLIKPALGENSVNAILTNKDVLKIFNSNLPNKELATKYKVDIAVIYQIKNGKNWSSITGKWYKPKTSRRPKEFLLKIFNENGSNSDIAKKYSIRSKDVWRIKNSKTLINK
jgi:hypothetical protein